MKLPNEKIKDLIPKMKNKEFKDFVAKERYGSKDHKTLMKELKKERDNDKPKKRRKQRKDKFQKRKIN